MVMRYGTATYQLVYGKTDEWEIMFRDRKIAICTREDEAKEIVDALNRN